MADYKVRLDRVINDKNFDATLVDIAKKVSEGQRVSFDDGVYLY